jgi:hypothetical protein
MFVYRITQVETMALDNQSYSNNKMPYGDLVVIRSAYIYSIVLNGEMHRISLYKYTGF